MQGRKDSARDRDPALFGLHQRGNERIFAPTGHPLDIVQHAHPEQHRNHRQADEDDCRDPLRVEKPTQPEDQRAEAQSRQLNEQAQQGV